MAEYITDLIQYVFDQAQIDFSAIDTTALDIEIQEYLENPDNGFMEETEEVWVDDATGYLTYVIDTTSPTTTVEEWKPANLEQTLNSSYLQNGQISIRDHNSPNYPLIDFKGKLFDFDADTSQDYPITPDTTGEIFLEFEYPTSEKVDGMYLQQGNDACQSYDGTTLVNVAMLNYYIGFSNDGVSWNYITNHEPMDTTSIVESIITSDEQEAIDNCFSIVQDCPIGAQAVEEVVFTDTAVEAKYWRLYLVDLLPVLERFDLDAGYTGYTASISHLRFQQFREHGDQMFDKTIDTIKTEGSYSLGDSGQAAGNSGAGWFTNLTFFQTWNNARELIIHISTRTYSAASVDWRIQYQEESGAAWQTLDTITGVTGYGSLNYSGIFENPQDNVKADWKYAIRIQDQAAAGTPATEYRISVTSLFRSTDVLEV